ncbi:hypothetical protein [Streptomyces sp. NPDC058451]|uniref:hypothetical protein n=1 Tax=Streptomyces sp. NPDC058451 TaxID=3346506 RepID=UPI003663D0F0
MATPRFQDRAETAWLRRALAAGGTAVVESADGVLAGGVLTGMGGVGKTQLAAHYARSARQAGELDVLVWIAAGSRSAAVTGYAQAAEELLGADPGDPESAARAFLAWLEPKPQQRPCLWLVVRWQMGSLFEELEAREAAARARVEELEAELAERSGKLELARKGLDRLR